MNKIRLQLVVFSLGLLVMQNSNMVLANEKSFMANVQEDTEKAELVFIGRYISHVQYTPTTKTLEEAKVGPRPPIFVHDAGVQNPSSVIPYVESVDFSIVELIKGDYPEEEISVTTLTQGGRSQKDRSGASDDVYSDASFFINNPYIIIFAYEMYFPLRGASLPAEKFYETRSVMNNAGFKTLEDAKAYLAGTVVNDDPVFYVKKDTAVPKMTPSFIQNIFTFFRSLFN